MKMVFQMGSLVESAFEMRTLVIETQKAAHPWFSVVCVGFNRATRLMEELEMVSTDWRANQENVQQ